MKKRIGLILCLVLVFTVVGCGNNGASGKTGSQPAGVKDVLEAGMAEEDSKTQSKEQGTAVSDDNAENARQSGINENAPKPQVTGRAGTATGGEEGIDIDLTVLSSTMVYSEVYNMMLTPENYVGKTVKMRGKFNLFHDKNTDKNYYSCIIADATACCSQGIEFVLTDDYTYPDDYPEKGDEICVTGVFELYQEGQFTYATLLDARLV